MRLYVVEPLGQGGLIHYSYHLCRAMARAGHEVTLVTSTHYELEDLPHEFRVERQWRLWHARRKTAQGFARKVQRAWRGLRYIREWVRVARYLIRQQPDVVLLGEVRFGFEQLFIRLLKLNGLTLADIVHDVRRYDTNDTSTDIVQQDPATLRAYSRIYNLFDHLFVHDRTNYDLFLELYDIPPERVHQIPHGSNEIMLEMPTEHTPQSIRSRLDLPPSAPVVLFFGTIAKYKGVEDLLHAFPVVAQQTDAHLLIAGYPAKDIDPDTLKQIAIDNGSAQRVTWLLDYVPNDQVVPMLQLAHLLVLPYRTISQSGILHLAYACGRPVVATRVGGLADVVEHGRSGLLVPPKDHDALAAAIVQLVQQPQRAEAMGQRAKELATAEYSWAQVARLLTQALGTK